MPTTVEVLSALLQDGQEIRKRLRADYFRFRQVPKFEPNTFLEPFRTEVSSWVGSVNRVLEHGFSSPVPSATFETAKVSPLREANTNIAWGNLLAYLEAKLDAVIRIIRDADPRTLSPLINPRAVFVVHGRSEVWNLAVASFLANRGFAAVVLEDQPNLGRTLIEKFEANADVGAAVVLFTADDVGCLRSELDTKGLSPRARQNVLIEMGFFFGRLGRNRVCLLKEPGVEIPTDLSGIVYTQIELSADSEWQEILSRDLAALGLIGVS